NLNISRPPLDTADLSSCLCVLTVFQHALAGVVEVYDGAESVLMPCPYKDQVPEDIPSIIWSRNDLNPNLVHLRRDEGDDLKNQNLVYRNRTSMTPDPLNAGDFSLTLRNLRLSDSGNYTCSLSSEIDEWKVTEVQLKVKGEQQTPSLQLIRGQITGNKKMNPIIFKNKKKILVKTKASIKRTAVEFLK
uniref:Ig-like domain-containing protein n=1 Tax=Kryptolebias marmoratus TaxID=37003 RepID=A0A3Q3BB39_KRYMA